MTDNLINGRIRAISTRRQGRLNLYGITDIRDLVLIRNALTASRIVPAISGAELNGIAIPEPASAWLLVVGLSTYCTRRRRDT